MAKSHDIGHAKAEPVDKTALKVTLPGYKYMSPKVVQTVESDPPIKTRWPRRCENRDPEFTKPHRDAARRLRVLGLAKGYSGLWACRCDCGKYVLRRSKGLEEREQQPGPMLTVPATGPPKRTEDHFRSTEATLKDGNE